MHAMTAYGRVDAWVHLFVILALDVVDWSVSRSGRFTRGEAIPVPV